MISASIPNSMRRAVYRRDGYRCALCDSTKYLQIHHLYPRSVGGAGYPMNLITLCMYCHAAIHGNALDAAREEQAERKEWAWQAAHEYLADYYAPDWSPWEG